MSGYGQYIQPLGSNCQFVIEVAWETPAWIAAYIFNYEDHCYEADCLVFQLERAGRFETWYEARDTVSHLKCGYPSWICQQVPLTERYRQKHAALAGIAPEILIGNESAQPAGIIQLGWNGK